MELATSFFPGAAGSASFFSISLSLVVFDLRLYCEAMEVLEVLCFSVLLQGKQRRHKREMRRKRNSGTAQEFEEQRFVGMSLSFSIKVFALAPFPLSVLPPAGAL